MRPDSSPPSPDDARIIVHVRDLGPGAAEHDPIQFRVKPTAKFKKLAVQRQQQQHGTDDDGCSASSPGVRFLEHGRRVLATPTVTVAERGGGVCQLGIEDGDEIDVAPQVMVGGGRDDASKR
ncbi:hypothetical protein GGF32_003133 [Allomyces javanicus]|nr:hypothetical protein GGF32_003133 [Allomyces javanicus]